jgi:hypothetical protein
MNYLPSWDFDQYKLDEELSPTLPNAETLVMAGWKFVKDPIELPSAPGVYIIHGGRDAQGKPQGYLYVGQAAHLRHRLSGHAQWQRARLEYTKPIIFYWDFKTVTRRNLLWYECYMIAHLNPKWNFGEKHSTVLDAVAGFDGIWD